MHAGMSPGSSCTVSAHPGMMCASAAMATTRSSKSRTSTQRVRQPVGLLAYACKGEHTPGENIPTQSFASCGGQLSVPVMFPPKTPEQHSRADIHACFIIITPCRLQVHRAPCGLHCAPLPPGNQCEVRGQPIARVRYPMRMGCSSQQSTVAAVRGQPCPFSRLQEKHKLLCVITTHAEAYGKGCSIRKCMYSCRAPQVPDAEGPAGIQCCNQQDGPEQDAVRPQQVGGGTLAGS